MNVYPNAAKVIDTPRMPQVHAYMLELAEVVSVNEKIVNELSGRLRAVLQITPENPATEKRSDEPLVPLAGMLHEILCTARRTHAELNRIGASLEI